MFVCLFFFLYNAILVYLCLSIKKHVSCFELLIISYFYYSSYHKKNELFLLQASVFFCTDKYLISDKYVLFKLFMYRNFKNKK